MVGRERCSRSWRRAILAVALVAGCVPATDAIPREPGLTVVNAWTSPVDVEVDGTPFALNVIPGEVRNGVLSAGLHLVVMRPTAGGAGVSIAATVTANLDHLIGVAGVRAVGGALAIASIEDTGPVPPAGQSRLRVLHLAPNAGDVAVWYRAGSASAPSRLAYPQSYQPNPGAAPTVLSSSPNWEVRLTTDTTTVPAPLPTAWSSATVTLSRRYFVSSAFTVLILDGPSGGAGLLEIP